MKLRRIISALLAALLVLFLASCGEEEGDPAMAEELNGVIQAANSENQLSGSYVLEINFGEGNVLYYAKGDIEFDRGEKRVYADFRQTWLGSAEAVLNYYSNGTMIAVSDGEAIEVQRDAEELFSKFPYAKLPLWSNNGKIALGDNTAGKTYSFVSKDTAQICETAVGDIYSLVTVIKTPQRDKTQYGDTTVTYTVADGKIAACRYEFTVKLFDTPAYNPNGYTPPESEYTVDLKVSAKVSYSGFGNAEIKEYSESSESSEISS